MVKILVIIAVAFVAAALSGIFLIPLLHRLKFGQEIREEGPKWHKKKSGTPTMGGFIFIIGALVSIAAMFVVFKSSRSLELFRKLSMLMLASLSFGAIGFLDDYIKVILKRNLGLKADQKMALQFLAALIFSVWLTLSGVVKPEIAVPFTNLRFQISIFAYIPFVILVMLAAVNSVNLTDGLDGLAAFVTLFVCIFYCISAKLEGDSALTVFAASLIGGLLGFILYNKYPAKIFMGDTGSLFLGGAVSVMAVYSENPLLLLVVGLVYVIESLSVIIQVTYFKKTGKRIFKMSPIHHHFEMCGWSERKIVFVFSLVTILLCVIGFMA